MKLRSVVPIVPLLLLSAAPFLALADMPLGPSLAGESRFAGAAARTVRAIVDYTRWPVQPNPVVLCVVGPAEHAGQLGAMRLSDGRRIERRDVAANPAALGTCHAVYLGNLPMVRQRELTAALRGRGILTVAEADPGNASEAMFVLTYQPQSLSFRLNVDAVSRSGLKIDPRVLRVARGGLEP